MKAGVTMYDDYNQQADGLYLQGGIDYSSPPDFNYKRLMGLGFSQVEIQTCENLFNRGAKFTPTFLQQYCGYDYETATKLKYLYDIAQGKIEIETDDELCKHLKKIFGKRRRVTIADLPPSNITEVPKLCLIAEITDPLFHIYNSGLYELHQRFYRVLQATPTKTVVRTHRKPEIKFRGSKEVEGVAKVLTDEPNADGSIDVQFDPKYTRLCNRYLILASTKRPEFHLGCYEIIVVDGSKVYVFGRTLPAKWDLKYKAAQERVLDSGIFPDELNKRITRAAEMVHKRLAGVKANTLEATSVFDLIHDPAAEYGSGDDADSVLSAVLDNIDIDIDI